MPVLIEATGLVKRFRKVTALDGLGHHAGGPAKSGAAGRSSGPLGPGRAGEARSHRLPQEKDRQRDMEEARR